MHTFGRYLAIVPQIRVKENNSSFLLFLTLTPLSFVIIVSLSIFIIFPVRFPDLWPFLSAQLSFFPSFFILLFLILSWVSFIRSFIHWAFPPSSCRWKNVLLSFKHFRSVYRPPPFTPVASPFLFRFRFHYSFPLFCSLPHEEEHKSRKHTHTEKRAYLKRWKIAIIFEWHFDVSRIDWDFATIYFLIVYFHLLSPSLSHAVYVLPGMIICRPYLKGLFTSFRERCQQFRCAIQSRFPGQNRNWLKYNMDKWKKEN